VTTQQADRPAIRKPHPANLSRLTLFLLADCQAPLPVYAEMAGCRERRGFGTLLALVGT